VDEETGKQGSTDPSKQEAGAQAAATAHGTHGSDEPPADPLAGLSVAGKELLGVSLDVIKDFAPRAGALDDLPQVSIDKQHVLEACRLMKEDPRVNGQMLLCLACVDFSEYFQLIYILQSLNPERTVAIRTDVPYSDASISSVTSIWRAADWYEREAHDLFGVDFDGHPDLSPLLLYEGFEGFPGRKEFPFNEYQEF
jgi:NADH-quinone oxidoreductase subunit C